MIKQDFMEALEYAQEIVDTMSTEDDCYKYMKTIVYSLEKHAGIKYKCHECKDTGVIRFTYDPWSGHGDYERKCSNCDMGDK